MATKRPRSNVWDHFTKDGEYASCLITACKARVKHCGNTSNLLKHLQSCHNKEHEKCVAERQTNSKKTKISTQMTLQESVSFSKKYPRDSSRCKKLDNALIEMIATDLQPSTIVEDPGFLKYTTLLDPRYEPPSRRTIMRRILPEKYTTVKEAIQQKLLLASDVAVTTDIWSSCQTLSYCCLTAHVISEAWELESYVLETFNFNTEHTAVHIAQELKRVVSDWGLTNITCCVTDNASNMVAGVREAGGRNLPCYAHTLNLVVQEAIKADTTLTFLQIKCKNIVSYFHRSIKASDKLRCVQEQLSLPQLKLIQDVATRWNSTYLMFERIVSQHEAVTTALCLLDKADMCISTEEKETIIKSLNLLEPFLQATEDISGDKYVSISMVIPLSRLLQRSCSKAPQSPLRQHLLSELQRRFALIESIYVMAIATLLDPRFKKLAFVDTSAMETAIHRLKGEIQDIAAQKEISETETEVQVQPQKERSLWDAFDEKVTEATSHRTPETDSFLEARRFFEEKNIDRKVNPLQW